MNLQELRRIAEQATQGEWSYHSTENHESKPTWDVYCENQYGITFIAECAEDNGDPERETDAAFIATFSPSRVLELLNRLEEAERVIGFYAKVAEEHYPQLQSTYSDSTQKWESICERARDYFKRYGESK